MGGYLDDNNTSGMDMYTGAADNARVGGSETVKSPGWHQHLDDPRGSKRYFDGEKWTNGYLPPAVMQPDVKPVEVEGTNLITVKGAPWWLWMLVTVGLALCFTAGFFLGQT